MGDWDVCDCGAIYFRNNGDICDSCSGAYCGECARGVFICDYHEFVETFGRLCIDNEDITRLKICTDCLILHLVERHFVCAELLGMFERLRGLTEERQRILRDIKNSYKSLRAMLAIRMEDI